MKKPIIAIVVCLIMAAISAIVIAADHVDAPAVGSLTSGSTAADITDFYAFESPDNSDNYVFVCNVQGLLAPGSATETANFDENVIYEFNIDTDNDNVEDLVIQTLFRDNSVISYGPVTPSVTGLESTIETSGTRVETEITTYGTEPKVGENNGVKLFAGPRDDPFFMDFFQFVSIVNGVGASLSDDTNTGQYDPERDSDPDTEGIQPYPAAFNEEGQDAFAGTNIMSVVVEVPKDMIGGSSVTNFNVWLKSKQEK